MSVQAIEFLRQLREIQNLFELGVEISADDEGISISGRDGPLPGFASNHTEFSYLERQYYVPWTFVDDDYELKDTLSEVISQIKFDNDVQETVRKTYVGLGRLKEAVVKAEKLS